MSVQAAVQRLELFCAQELGKRVFCFEAESQNKYKIPDLTPFVTWSFMQYNFLINHRKRAGG